MPKLEAVLAQAFELGTIDKLRLIEQVTPRIEEEVRNIRARPVKPYSSLWGTCQTMGPAPSAKDIDMARRDMWQDFPRDDIG